MWWNWKTVFAKSQPQAACAAFIHRKVHEYTYFMWTIPHFIQGEMHKYTYFMWTVPLSGLEKLGFLGNESSCSSKQVEGNVVRLIILRFLWRYELKMFASPFTSLCTKSNRLWKENCWNKFRYSYIQCFFFSDSIITLENITTCSLNDSNYLRILKKFALDKNQKVNVQITSQIL